jgi:hypothetical protein
VRAVYQPEISGTSIVVIFFGALVTRRARLFATGHTVGATSAFGLSPDGSSFFLVLARDFSSGEKSLLPQRTSIGRLAYLFHDLA